MEKRVLNEEEIMDLISKVFDEYKDIKDVRENLMALINNEDISFSNDIKSILKYAISTDENLNKFKSDLIDSRNKKPIEPVIIPEAPNDLFFDKLMTRGIIKSKLLDRKIIIPYLRNNQQLIYALMGKSLENDFNFILSNISGNANFILRAADNNLENDPFYSKMSTIVDGLDVNRDYLGTLGNELYKMVFLFNDAINSNTDFNIGLTNRNGKKEIIITLADQEIIESLQNSGVSVNDNKIRITDNFLNILDGIENKMTTTKENYTPIIYHLYDSKKADGTDIKTYLFEEEKGRNVYMSTNINNKDALVNIEKDYLFSSKERFYNTLNTFFKEDEKVEKRTGKIEKVSSEPVSYLILLDDQTTKKWGPSGSKIDNYEEVIKLYSQLETLPKRENESFQNSSKGNQQVLVKNNPNIPAILPSEEKDNTTAINNSGFSSTFLFVTLVATELMAIALGILLFIK